MHPLTGSRLLANEERFRFDATSVVVSTPSPQQGATQVSLRLNGFVTGNRSVARPLPGSACQHAREGAWCNDAVLSKMTTQCIDRLGALTDEHLS